MDIALKVGEDPDGKALRSLHKRLTRDRYVYDNAQPVLAESSDMAVDLATIELLLTAGFKLAELALQIASWLKESRRAKPITISSGGWQTEVSREDVEQSGNDAVLRALVGAPNPSLTRCVLIGVSKYENLSGLSKVRSNLDQLREALTDPGIWGVPASHVETIENPESFGKIRAAITQAAAEKPEVLLVYFAGHGMKDQQERLLLALPGARKGEEAQTIAWQELARVIGKADARRKIVLLDCCYAGTAIEGGVSPANTYVMAASHTQARVLERERNTAFTGELVKVLRDGIEPGRPTQEFLSLESVYTQVRIGLRSRKLPEPSRHGPEAIGSWPIFYNRLDAADKRAPSPGPGPFRDVMRRHPRRAFVGAALVLVLLLAGLVAFLTPGPVTSGLDLTRYCSTLAPGGSTSFVITGQDCVRPVNLDDACVYSYATYGLRAAPASPDPNSYECKGPGASSTSLGGISNMSGFCATSSRVPGVTATSKNPKYQDKWMCQLDINLDLACNAQNNTLELSAREEDNGDLECYRTHWF